MSNEFDIERRISQESRLVVLEQKVSTIEVDVKDTKTLIGGINTSLQHLASEFSAAKASATTLFKTLSIIGTILIVLISGVYAVGYLQLPKIEHHLDHD